MCIRDRQYSVEINFSVIICVDVASFLVSLVEILNAQEIKDVYKRQAGFMIDNMAKGILKQWHLEDMDKISRDKSVVLLDVRTAVSYTHLQIKKC